MDLAVIAGRSLWRHGLSPSPEHVVFVLDNLAPDCFFSPGISVFPYQYHSTVAAYSYFIHLSSTLVTAYVQERFYPFYSDEGPYWKYRLSSILFSDLGTGRGWGVSVTPRPLSTPSKDPVPIVQEAGWAPESIWTGAENLAPTGIRSPIRPARSQSLYLLSYPAHLHTTVPQDNFLHWFSVETLWGK
jgi:hypothetical protein